MCPDDNPMMLLCDGQVTAVPAHGFLDNCYLKRSHLATATCPNLFASMAMVTPLKLVLHIGKTSRVVAPPDDLHDETHESEFSEDSDQFQDEDSDYGNCA